MALVVATGTQAAIALVVGSGRVEQSY